MIDKYCENNHMKENLIVDLVASSVIFSSNSTVKLCIIQSLRI